MKKTLLLTLAALCAALTSVSADLYTLTLVNAGDYCIATTTRTTSSTDRLTVINKMQTPYLTKVTEGGAHRAVPYGPLAEGVCTYKSTTGGGTGGGGNNKGQGVFGEDFVLHLDFINTDTGNVTRYDFNNPFVYGTIVFSGSMYGGNWSISTYGGNMTPAVTPGTNTLAAPQTFLKWKAKDQ